MNKLCIASAALFISAGGAAAQGFPKQMQGFWTNSPMTCAVSKSRGMRFLESGAKSGTSDHWVRINVETVTGTTKARYVRTTGVRSVEAQDQENSNIMIDFTLRRDGFLEETIVGARASAMYVRCR